MYYIYILKSPESDNVYIGFTSKPKGRLEQHNSGQSLFTKRYLNWKPVYLEGYANLFDAKDREKKLKQFGRVYSQLKRRVRRSLNP